MKRKIGLYLLPCSTVGRPIRACKDGMIMKSMSASAATATHYMYGSFKLDLSTLLARSSLEILIGHLRRKKEKQIVSGVHLHIRECLCRSLSVAYLKSYATSSPLPSVSRVGLGCRTKVVGNGFVRSEVAATAEACSVSDELDDFFDENGD